MHKTAKEIMLIQKRPMTQKQLNLLKIKWNDFKDEYKKAITFFKERDAYKKQLRRAINKYGIANLSPTIQRTIPTNLIVLYEPSWIFNPYVWFMLILIAYRGAKNIAIRRIIDEK